MQLFSADTTIFLKNVNENIRNLPSKALLGRFQYWQPAHNQPNFSIPYGSLRDLYLMTLIGITLCKISIKDACRFVQLRGN